MTEMYGHKWVSAYGEKDAGTWAKGLAGLSGEQLSRGVKACFRREETWPPTLPEFRALCLQAPPENAAMYRVYRALPRPPGNKQVAAAAIQQMREKLA